MISFKKDLDMKKLNFLRAVLVMILLTVIYVAIFIMPEIAEGLALKYRDFSSYKNFFLIIVYISLVPVGLIIYSTFKLLNIIEKERKFDRKAIREFDIIKYSSAIGAFISSNPLISNYKKSTYISCNDFTINRRTWIFSTCYDILNY